MATIDLAIHIDSPEDIAVLFDRIQVWRSDSQNGTYIDISSNDGSAATIEGSIAAPWALNGKTLTVVLNMASPVDIVFTGTDPLSLSSVLGKINAIIPGLAIEVPTDTGRIRLRSSVIGTQSSISVSGNACAVLGLSTNKVNGTGARPLLSVNTEDYSFRDFDGSDSFWYKTRYYSSTTGAVSEFSDPMVGGPGTAIQASHLVVGKIALADSSGAPIVGRRIIFVPVSPQIVTEGSNNYGILPSVDRIVIFTDASGKASTNLVKNQRLKVFIEGTTFQREFVVPTTDFDILTVSTTQPDPLNIVTSPPMPIRVS